jgi:uncharacterized protein
VAINGSSVYLRTKMQSPFVWYDLMTSDVDGAKKFYADVVEWTFSAQGPDYHVANVGAAGMGGIMKSPAKDVPPFWSGYVYTPDVDAACARILQLGGKVHRAPWDVPGVLRMAIVGDPTGANFNIMQPLMQGPREVPPQGALGTIAWHELHAGDLDVAWEFYAAMFGWTQGTAIQMGPMGTYQMFQIDGKDIGGMMQKRASTPMPVWSYYFNVDGIDRAAARIVQSGGKLVMGPHQVPGGSWIVTAIDPQGGHFSLTSESK